MSKKTEFISYIEAKVGDFRDASQEVLDYWNAFRAVEDKEKPLFTDNGKMIIKYMQENIETIPVAKAKDIGEGLFISSRAVSGALRKLVTDGYFEKIGTWSENPIKISDFLFINPYPAPAAIPVKTIPALNVEKISLLFIPEKIYSPEKRKI